MAKDPVCGMQVAEDGVVVEGHSAVDESMISGEPIPIEKAADDKVIGNALRLRRLRMPAMAVPTGC